MNSEKCVKCSGPTRCGSPGCTCEPIPMTSIHKTGERISYPGSFVCGKCFLLQQVRLIRAEMQMMGILVVDLSDPSGPG